MSDNETNGISIMSNHTNEEGCMQNNLPFRAVRVGMETKGLLANAGDMYIGTGQIQQVTVTTADNVIHTYEIPVTTKLDGPTAPGRYVLSCTSDANGVLSYKWESVNQ